jgi:GTP-binding protein EngB required for normal cell division
LLASLIRSCALSPVAQSKVKQNFTDGHIKYLVDHTLDAGCIQPGDVSADHSSIFRCFSDIKNGIATLASEPFLYASVGRYVILRSPSRWRAVSALCEFVEDSSLVDMCYMQPGNVGPGWSSLIEHQMDRYLAHIRGAFDTDFKNVEAYHTDSTSVPRTVERYDVTNIQPFCSEVIIDNSTMGIMEPNSEGLHVVRVTLKGRHLDQVRSVSIEFLAANIVVEDVDRTNCSCAFNVPAANVNSLLQRDNFDNYVRVALVSNFATENTFSDSVPIQLKAKRRSIVSTTDLFKDTTLRIIHANKRTCRDIFSISKSTSLLRAAMAATPIEAFFSALTVPKYVHMFAAVLESKALPVESFLSEAMISIIGESISGLEKYIDELEKRMRKARKVAIGQILDEMAVVEAAIRNVSATQTVVVQSYERYTSLVLQAALLGGGALILVEGAAIAASSLVAAVGVGIVLAGMFARALSSARDRLAERDIPERISQLRKAVADLRVRQRSLTTHSERYKCPRFCGVSLDVLDEHGNPFFDLVRRVGVAKHNVEEADAKLIEIQGAAAGDLKSAEEETKAQKIYMKCIDKALESAFLPAFLMDFHMCSEHGTELQEAFWDVPSDADGFLSNAFGAIKKGGLFAFGVAETVVKTVVSAPVALGKAAYNANTDALHDLKENVYKSHTRWTSRALSLKSYEKALDYFFEAMKPPVELKQSGNIIQKEMSVMIYCSCLPYDTRITFDTPLSEVLRKWERLFPLDAQHENTKVALQTLHFCPTGFRSVLACKLLTILVVYELRNCHTKPIVLVQGVSNSGKSTLVDGLLRHEDGEYVADLDFGPVRVGKGSTNRTVLPSLYSHVDLPYLVMDMPGKDDTTLKFNYPKLVQNIRSIDVFIVHIDSHTKANRDLWNKTINIGSKSGVVTPSLTCINFVDTLLDQQQKKKLSRRESRRAARRGNYNVEQKSIVSLPEQLSTLVWRARGGVEDYHLRQAHVDDDWAKLFQDPTSIHELHPRWLTTIDESEWLDGEIPDVLRGIVHGEDDVLDWVHRTCRQL